jgi:3-methyladenine DNA glycosylase AlkD
MMPEPIDRLPTSQKTISRFRQQFKRLGDPERAAQETRYLKSPFKFYGVSVPQIRAVARQFRRENRDVSKEALWDICQALWQGEFHEERALAMFLLEEHRTLLDYSDIPLLERMLRESTNWDQVDEISVHLVGSVLQKDQRALEYLKGWSRDPNFWMRRAALISQLLLFRERKGDKGLFYSFADEMMEEKEFFIRKAIGWVLRDISKVDPEEVFRFVAENKDRMSGVTFREATRRLPQHLREQLTDR